MKSQKYTGWEIEKEIGLENKVTYFMTRPDWEAKGIRYAITVSQHGGEWMAEYLTWSNKYEEYTYVAAEKQFNGPVPVVVKEIERRAAYWMSKGYNN